MTLDSAGLADPNSATATAYGSVDALTLDNPGSGHTFPTVDFDMPDDPNGVKAEGSVQTDANGAVTGVTITNAGSGYATAPNVVTETTAPLAGSLVAALRLAFPVVRCGAGPDAFLVAGSSARAVTLDPQVLAARWRARGVESPSFHPAMLAALLAPARVATDEAAHLVAAARAEANRDDRPVTFQHALARRHQATPGRWETVTRAGYHRSLLTNRSVCDPAQPIPKLFLCSLPGEVITAPITSPTSFHRVRMTPLSDSADALAGVTRCPYAGANKMYAGSRASASIQSASEADTARSRRPRRLLQVMRSSLYALRGGSQWKR